MYFSLNTILRVIGENATLQRKFTGINAADGSTSILAFMGHLQPKILV
jgi:hypothetical protein